MVDREDLQILKIYDWMNKAKVFMEKNSYGSAVEITIIL